MKEDSSKVKTMSFFNLVLGGYRALDYALNYGDPKIVALMDEYMKGIVPPEGEKLKEVKEEPNKEELGSPKQ